MGDYANKLTALDTVTALPDAGAEYMKGDESGASDVINRTAKANRGYIENLVDGAIGNNLIINGNVEQWTNGASAAPDDWGLSGAGATIARVTTKKSGTYAAQITYGSAGVNLYQDAPEYVYFQNRPVTISAYVKCSTASIARLSISDGVGESTSDYHTGGGDWELLTVTRIIDAGATFVRAACQVTGAGNAIFDLIKIEEGQIATPFTPYIVTPYASETLRNKTLITPTVADLSNMTHDHSDAANGGALVSPAFQVNKNGSTQSISPSTWTKATWSTEEFDTNSDFASNAFTPTLAGKYLLTAQVKFPSFAANYWIKIAIYKNGALVKMRDFFAPNSVDQSVSVTTIQAANGSSDYFEVYVFHTVGTARDISGDTDVTWFSGSLVSRE